MSAVTAAGERTRQAAETEARTVEQISSLSSFDFGAGLRGVCITFPGTVKGERVCFAARPGRITLLPGTPIIPPTSTTPSPPPPPSAPLSGDWARG